MYSSSDYAEYDEFEERMNVSDQMLKSLKLHHNVDTTESLHIITRKNENLYGGHHTEWLMS